MENLDWVFGDGVGEAADCFVQRGRERLDCQPLESLDQCVAKTVQPVAVTDNALALNVVQNLSHLVRRVLLMIQKRNEIRNRAFEINVVFPKSVIGIDEQRLRVRIKLLGHHST
jgi:hypothetical protein